MSPPLLSPGTVISGKYSIHAVLGSGGAAVTYLATGAEGREVALKLFDPAIRQRADVMAALEQVYAGTNALPLDVVAPILDAGYDPATGAPFSVTERIPVASLAQFIGQRPLTPEEVGQTLRSLGRALDAAHAVQLMHHALKPTNVFVGFAPVPAVRLTDFGASLARTAVPTPEGYALAAPWLSPEQVQGGAPAGASADVFAAALLAFFALTGRSYWRACQGGAPDLAAWQREVLSPRTPPSARALQLGVALNSAFDSVLGAALALDPRERFRSAGELANAFEALVTSKVPDSAHTQAFPAFHLGGGDYPPPPPPMGGMAPPHAGNLGTAPTLLPPAGMPPPGAGQGAVPQGGMGAMHPPPGGMAPPGMGAMTPLPRPAPGGV